MSHCTPRTTIRNKQTEKIPKTLKLPQEIESYFLTRTPIAQEIRARKNEIASN
jgi:hypothetical protein